MIKPVLLAVDDDPEVVRATERDLRRKYSSQYRVLREESGEAALKTLRDLKKRNEPVALLLSDQRMPHMDGIAFLDHARELYPAAKRALLTAYADTEVAIRAINQVKIHHYLMKPWDPPEEHLYPVVDDLLDDWQAGYRPTFEGVRVIGSRWSPKTYEIRDFLARHQIPYRWLDVENASQDPESSQLLKSLPENVRYPAVLLADGSLLEQPSLSELAEKVGLHTRAAAQFYDLVIVGGGPAGLAAAVYGASEGLRTVIVEREAPGGQAGLSSRIENYLGFPSGLSGGDLARRAVIQARRFGVEILAPLEVRALRVEGTYRIIELSNGTEISAHAVIIATGVQWRRLDIPEMDRLIDAGIYYGAGSTEAMSCRDEDVYVVGGANSAGQAAMNFSRFARRVIMLVRGPSLSATMSQYLIDQIKETPNIEVRTGAEVVGVSGQDRLESISIRCRETGQVEQEPASALFIFIGAMPRTDWLGTVVERDDKGFILSGPELVHNGKRPKGWTLDRDPGLLETSVPGVFVVGDVRKGSVKRVASGVGEGSVAVQFVHQYLSNV